MAARQHAAGAFIGLVFGFMLCWSGMVDPDVIRQALLFEDAYMFFFMGSAVGTAAIGLRILARLGRRAVLVDEPIAWTPERATRRHVGGSLLFGLGWGVSGACPGPVAAQVGQGIGWGFVTLVGVLAGVWLYMRREGAVETEPASDATAAPDPSARAVVPA
ncbi:DUF6691 family protein [Paraconexibacter algicola]|uniref:Uncharacterized protein n=1 Tax=Paraconexibacter algicola TaxID=2133960 RepID=A0A2T4UDI1_9ACTN|nr:DUF6691 family protein [Paraconexibacter algicola]PTL55535.1 hypothetical protein C7Y72_17975 [Paraconexibacter algicola]